MAFYSDTATQVGSDGRSPHERYVLARQWPKMGSGLWCWKCSDPRPLPSSPSRSACEAIQYPSSRYRRGSGKQAGGLLATLAASRNGKELAKTLAMRPPREYNVSEGLARRKPMSFHKLQHHANATAIRPVVTQSRLRGRTFYSRKSRIDNDLRLFSVFLFFARETRQAFGLAECVLPREGAPFDLKHSPSPPFRPVPTIFGLPSGKTCRPKRIKASSCYFDLRATWTRSSRTARESPNADRRQVMPRRDSRSRRLAALMQRVIAGGMALGDGNSLHVQPGRGKLALPKTGEGLRTFVGGMTLVSKSA